VTHKGELPATGREINDTRQTQHEIYRRSKVAEQTKQKRIPTFAPARDKPGEIVGGAGVCYDDQQVHARQIKTSAVQDEKTMLLPESTFTLAVLPPPHPCKFFKMENDR
jgi:hypothetical protein